MPFRTRTLPPVRLGTARMVYSPHPPEGPGIPRPVTFSAAQLTNLTKVS